MDQPRPPHLVALGRALRRARQARDLSQEALGNAAGLAAKHVSEIERGNRDPRLTTLLKLARALRMEDEGLLRLYRKLIAASEA
jgi:transcriptional regulator with XRE-family HTH domain